jgi:hypothetical protein
MATEVFLSEGFAACVNPLKNSPVTGMTSDVTPKFQTRL